MGAKMKGAFKTAMDVYLVLILFVLPLYVRDGYVMIGNAKYLFFRNVTLFFMVVTAGILGFKAIAEKGQGKRPWMFSATDTMVLLYAGGAVLSWCFSADRHTAWWGTPGWYMGLLSQLMFVWVYFAVSRRCGELEGVLWVFFAGAAVVMALGVLNRYNFDPLSMSEGLGDWNREHLLSTVGNQNWYCGYVSAAYSVCFCFACGGSGSRRAAGLAGSLLCFWTVMTQGGEGGYLILLAGLAVAFLWCLDDRGRLAAFLGLLTCWPVAALAGQYCIRFRGLVLVEDGTLGGLLFWKGWLPALAILGALDLLLYVRGRKGWADKLQRQSEKRQKAGVFHPDLSRGRRCGMEVGVKRTSGRSQQRLFYGKVLNFPNGFNSWKRAALWAAGALLLIGAGVFLACQLWEGVWRFLGEKEILRITDSWGNGRGAIWRIAMGSFLRMDFPDQLIGVGPDCFCNIVSEMYPVQDMIHTTGQWEAAFYANAHNEFLNMLVNQGILGLVSYMGIFVTLFVRLWKHSPGDLRALLGLLAISGYCAYGMVSFQQTVSTPIMFAVLGISEAMLRESLKKI